MECKTKDFILTVQYLKSWCIKTLGLTPNLSLWCTQSHTTSVDVIDMFTRVLSKGFYRFTKQNQGRSK